jgi:hypothetical protein
LSPKNAGSGRRRNWPFWKESPFSARSCVNSPIGPDWSQLVWVGLLTVTVLVTVGAPRGSDLTDRNRPPQTILQPMKSHPRNRRLTACHSWAKYVTWAHARAYAAEVGRSCEKESPLCSIIFIVLAVHPGQLDDFNGMASARQGTGSSRSL